ncbi:MAG: hypothetical protein HQL83_15220 [Magnetococcales bacterium]|nr:hypothetical protein [Magnetococcales bacterium]MBF0631015.1 hypothetical protein [Magnetococcales bacterium]
MAPFIDFATGNLFDMAGIDFQSNDSVRFKGGVGVPQLDAGACMTTIPASHSSTHSAKARRSGLKPLNSLVSEWMILPIVLQ